MKKHASKTGSKKHQAFDPAKEGKKIRHGMKVLRKLQKKPKGK